MNSEGDGEEDLGFQRRMLPLIEEDKALIIVENELLGLLTAIAARRECVLLGRELSKDPHLFMRTLQVRCTVCACREGMRYSWLNDRIRC